MLKFQCPRCGRCGSRAWLNYYGAGRGSFQCPRCGRCGSRGAKLPSIGGTSRVSMPSVRAVWLARPPPHCVQTMRASFNALGAGGVARAWSHFIGHGSAILFQCPRCGRCGSRAGCSGVPENRGTGFNALGAGGVARATAAPFVVRKHGRVSMPSVRAVWLARSTTRSGTDSRWRVSMPSVRAVWLARRQNDTREETERCFNALGAGGVARALLRPPSTRRSSRVSMPSVRAVWLARQMNLTTQSQGFKFQCPRCGRCGSRGGDLLQLNSSGGHVSMPSVRAVWLARQLRPASRSAITRFNALGAGGVARAKSRSRSVWASRRPFQCPRCGRCGSRGVGSIQNAAAVLKFQCPRCGRCGSRGGCVASLDRDVSMFQCPRCGRCGSRDETFAEKLSST